MSPLVSLFRNLLTWDRICVNETVSCIIDLFKNRQLSSNVIFRITNFET